MSFLLTITLLAKENNSNEIVAIQAGSRYRLAIIIAATVVEKAITYLLKDVLLNFCVKRTLRLMKWREKAANTAGLAFVEVSTNISDTDITHYFIIITNSEDIKFNSLPAFQRKSKADLLACNQIPLFLIEAHSTFSFVAQYHF